MGKRRATPGTGQLNLEIELTLLEQLREFVRTRGETQRQAVEAALWRHMANPPPIPVLPPLPPITVPTPTATVPVNSGMKQGGGAVLRGAAAGKPARKRGKK
jgi:hypothetical protein